MTRWTTLLVTLAVTCAFLFTASAAGQAPPASPTPETPPPRPADRMPEGLVPLEGAVLVEDVIYSTITGDRGAIVELTMDVAVPRESGDEALPAVLFVHGGGWSSGDKGQGRALLAPFARGGYVVASISYRLAPEWTFPAAVHDCKAAVRFLRLHAAELGIDPDRIGIIGHSAGGTLAALVATTGNSRSLDSSGSSDVGAQVACAVSVAGPSDLTDELEPYAEQVVRQWLGEGSDGAGRDEKTRRNASPVYWVDPDDPPMLLVHGDADPLVPIRQAELLHARLEERDVSVDLHRVVGGGHNIEDKKSYAALAAFLDDHLGGDLRSQLDARRGQGAADGTGGAGAGSVEPGVTD